MALPDFIIIGAQRSGTGWVSQCLREHPDIFMARDETRFFDNDFEKGEPWWEKTFFGATNQEKRIGEKTANYLYHPKVPERIKEKLPDTELICILRNPIDRLYSNYYMKFGSSNSSKSIIEICKNDKTLIERGFYFEQLSRYLNYFPREKILIKIYDDKNIDTLGFIQDIYRFLKIDSNFIPTSVNIQTKQGRFENKNVLLRLISRYIFSKYTPGKIKKMYTKLRSNKFMPHKDEIAFFKEIYLNDIEKLSILLDRDLSCWITRYEKNC